MAESSVGSQRTGMRARACFSVRWNIVCVAVISAVFAMIAFMSFDGGLPDAAGSGQATATPTTTALPTLTPEERAALPRFNVRATDVVSFEPVEGASSYRVTGSAEGLSFRVDGRCAGRDAQPFDVPLDRTLPASTSTIVFEAPIPQEPPPSGQFWSVLSVSAIVEALDEDGRVIAEGAGGGIGEPLPCPDLIATSTPTIATTASAGSNVRPPETGHGPDSY
jgi:hypothetical protein